MAFSFGSTTATPASTTATTGFSLGGPPAKTPATGFSFGATTTTTQPSAPNSGFSFGSSATTTTSPQRFVAVRTVNRSKRTVSPHTVIRSEELSSRESGFSFRG